MKTESYTSYKKRIPTTGQQIIAYYDDEGIFVYQAFRPSIADYASANQKFGGNDYSFTRMSWIKPNFLWMMYRSGWATKAGQERILSIKLTHDGFNEILRAATHSSFQEHIYKSHEDWQEELTKTEVRLQWDPDHNPKGEKIERRAIQLGIKGKMLEAFNQKYIIAIEDITEFVADQRTKLDDEDDLQVPVEQIYAITNSDLVRKLKLKSE